MSILNIFPSIFQKILSFNYIFEVVNIRFDKIMIDWKDNKKNHYLLQTEIGRN